MFRYHTGWGTSWRGRQPGTRHWRSHGLSMPLGLWVLGTIGWWLIGVPLLVELWLIAQITFLFCTALIAVCGMAMYRRGPQHIRMLRWGWFWLIDLDLDN